MQLSAEQQSKSKRAAAIFHKRFLKLWHEAKAICLLSQLEAVKCLMTVLVFKDGKPQNLDEAVQGFIHSDHKHS